MGAVFLIPSTIVIGSLESMGGETTLTLRYPSLSMWIWWISTLRIVLKEYGSGIPFWLLILRAWINLNPISEPGANLALFYPSTEYQLKSITSSEAGLAMYRGGASFWFSTVLDMMNVSATRELLANLTLYYLFWRSQGWLITSFPKRKWLLSICLEAPVRESEGGVSFLILVNMVSMNHNQIV